MTYWGLWEQEQVMRPLFDQFQASHPKVKIEYIMQSPTEYRERLQSALSQGRGPDIFRIHNTWIPMLRADLSPVPVEIYSPSQFESLFYPIVKTDLSWGGNFVAIPLEFDGLAMFSNTDLVESAGISIPQNWDELRNAALAVSRCEGPKNNVCGGDSRVLIAGVTLGNTENVDHWQDIISLLMFQNNVNPGNPASNPNSARDVFEYFSGFEKTYQIWSPTLPNSTTLFAQGKAGFYFAPSWRIFDIKALNPNLRFKVHPLPQLPVDPTRGEHPVTWASYWVEVVNKKSPNAQAAWELLQFLSSPEAQAQMYQQARSVGRDFGEPYSRVDLAATLVDDPLVGPYLKGAPLAKSWYLASATKDGPSGINSRLSAAFTKGIRLELDITKLSAEINQILSEYGISAATQTQ